MHTLMELNIIDNITQLIRQHMILFDAFDNVYLFGSILNVNKIPNDIDILLIYSKYSSKITIELSFIRTALEEISGLPVDLTVLSIEEEKDTEFLKKIYPIFLKLK